MMRAGFFICGAIATGVHLGAFHLAAPQGGTQSGGAKGADQVSVSAAAPQMQNLVKRWARVPEVSTQSVRVAQPSVAVESINAPSIAALQPRPSVALPALPNAPRSAPVEDPVVETTPAVAPPPPPEPPAPKPVAKAPAPKPAPKAPAAAPAPKKQASGTGAAQRQSTGGTTAAQSLSKAQVASLQARWNAQIYSKIKRNMRTPRGSAGTAKIALTVSRDGKLQGASLMRSSGNAALDQAALKAVRRARRFAKAPKGLTKPQYRFAISLSVSK